MVESILSGIAGISLVNFSFVAALISLIAFSLSIFRKPEAASWEAIGKWAFFLHGISAIGIITVLFGLILTQQYQYHYVWSHSSNELPLNYAIACLWEGQEGSFLLWITWHAVLGLIFLKTGGSWRPGVLATLSSIQVILLSMVLGVYLDEKAVYVLYVIFMLIPAAYLAYAAFKKEYSNSNHHFLLAFAAILVLSVSINLFREQTGFAPTLKSSLNIVFLLEILFIFIFLFFINWSYWKNRISFAIYSAATVIALLALVAAWVSIGSWKIGSSPFLTLKEIRPNDPIYALNPDFVPLNGKGLNSLLQNYWMVIHPPTLFLGFAATAIPFCFVITALIQRKYTEWIHAAGTWTIFAVMVLGIGIIMGGYWAYETLNFGGYWNWDPVENASLVPWLTGVAALHGMLAYRKSKTNLHLTFLLVILTFIFVLYSTFLTRSGILGEASVHSFTDLGLSGQLLVLLFAYVVFIVLLLIRHWNLMPQDQKEVSFWSREFFLFLAAIILFFSAIEITIFTSLPVFNKIFGTNLAPPARVPFFYYKWNVWFGILIALFSAVGQFFYWTKIEKKTILNALYRPFLLAIVSTFVVMGLMMAHNLSHDMTDERWEFMFHKDFVENIEKAQKDGNIFEIIYAYFANGFLMIADDILLLCAFYSLFANIIIIFRLLWGKLNNLKHIGGSLAHIGFGLMLLGMLFSAGYERVMSVNLSPGELAAGFPENEQKENVQLWRNTPKPIKGYNVLYKGKKQAQGPIREIKILSDDSEVAKASFKDSLGDRYAIEFPSRFFRSQPIAATSPFVRTSVNSKIDQKTYDLEKLRFFIEKQIDLLQPNMINDRSLYELQFTSLDSTKRFILFPEAEKSSEMGITSHPDRKIFWNQDLYVHVSSIPTDSEDRWLLLTPELKLSVGDTATVGKYKLQLKKVQTVKEGEKFYNTELIAKAIILVEDGGKIFEANPMIVFDKSQKMPIMVDSYLSESKLSISFVTALPNENKIVIRIKQKVEQPDFITIKAISKPFINLLWLGTFVMSFGFITAIIRRLKESKREQQQ